MVFVGEVPYRAHINTRLVGHSPIYLSHNHPEIINIMSEPQGSQIRLATASPCTQATKAATLQQLRELCGRAASQRVDILVLPEAYIGGYPRGSTFRSPVGSRLRKDRDEYLRYFSQAVDLGDTVNGGAGEGDAWIRRQLATGQPEAGMQRMDGDGTREELEEIAMESGIFLVVGLIERAGGSLYCAVVYVCPKWGMVGKRRKVMPVSLGTPIYRPGCSVILMYFLA